MSTIPWSRQDAGGESLSLQVIVASASPPVQAALFWREMGLGEFRQLRLKHVARGVYTVSLPSGGAKADLEYYVEAAWPSGPTVRFPTTAPELNQTLVVLPQSE